MEPKKPFWKRWAGWASAFSWTWGTFWGVAKWIGLAGLPEDTNAVYRGANDMIAAIPPPVFWGALGASFMAALIFSVIYLTENWADRAKAAVRKALGRAGKLVSTIRIGSAEYIPFDNLIDVVSEIDMKPLGEEGVRCGTLPAGTNLVCLPNGHVRLALPVRLSGLGVSAVGSLSAAVLKVTPPEQDKPDDG